MRQPMTLHDDPIKMKSASRSVASAIERRKSQRVPMRFPIKWRVRGSSRWQTATCENLSGGGLGLCIHAPCPDRSTIEAILMPPKPKPLRAVCSVRWHKPLIKNKTFLGVAFVTLTDLPRFMEFLCEHLLEQTLDDGSLPAESAGSIHA